MSKEWDISVQYSSLLFPALLTTHNTLRAMQGTVCQVHLIVPGLRDTGQGEGRSVPAFAVPIFHWSLSFADNLVKSSTESTICHSLGRSLC